MFLKVIACEIAFREICHAAASCSNILDLEFLPQGYHDTPKIGTTEVQKRVDAVPANKYDAILLGYGLCSNIITSLQSSHTRLVIPRAHDCITFFLGSKERYQSFFQENPGTYYYTSGWLECIRRRGDKALQQGCSFLAKNFKSAADATFQQWVEKYGLEEAKYLAETMGGWASAYQNGTLIDFDFTRHLNLSENVRSICAEQGWKYGETEGDMSLIKRWLNGDWSENDFLTVPPGRKVTATFNDSIIGTE